MMKNTLQNLSGIWVVVLTCVLHAAKSQHSLYTSKLPEITKSDFYKILLTPDLVSKTGGKFNRVRIYHEKNEVPYLLKKNPLTTTTARFRELPILEKNRKDSLEFVVFGNLDSANLTSIQITLKRAWTAKMVKVRGSYDGKIWYAVRGQFLMDLADGAAGSKQTEIVYTLDLPSTNYRFYKLEGNNSEDLALNIVSVGHFSNSQQNGSMMPLPSPRVDKLKTEDKSTDLFRVTFNEPYLVNKLVFNVGQPHFFHRNVRLYSHNPIKETSGKRRKNEVAAEPIAYFTLTSKDSVNATEFGDIFSSQFFALVENQDNPSLQIDSVQGYYNPYYLKVYLESEKEYALHINGSDLAAPVYDLSNFDNGSDDQVQTLELKTIDKKNLLDPTADEPFFNNKIWLNVGLLFVAVILGYACIQMLQDIRK